MNDEAISCLNRNPSKNDSLYPKDCFGEAGFWLSGMFIAPRNDDAHPHVFTYELLKRQQRQPKTAIEGTVIARRKNSP